METYQAIYDAVRSRLSNGNIGQAVETVLREADIGFHISKAADSIQQNASAEILKYGTPSVIYRPSLSVDGGKWCALYGDNLQDGVAGFGDTPEAAMEEFDKAWKSSLAHKR